MVTKRTAPESPPEEDHTGDGEPLDESRVREVVRETLASLGIGGDDTGDQGGDEPEPEADKPTGRGQAAVEADVEAKVRAEIAKLRGEEDRDRRLAELEKKTAAPERPPVKERVSTRLMGWNRSRSRS